MSSESGKSANNKPFITLTRAFQRDLRHLAKKFRKIRQDLETLWQELAKGGRPGEVG